MLSISSGCTESKYRNESRELFCFYSEHRITRGAAGYWREDRKLFHKSSSEVPFQITNKSVGIEIIEPLTADILGKKFDC